MRWDRFFEDLEDQLSSEWEAERAALDTEAERLRLSRVTLRERLRALITDDHPPEPVRDGGAAASAPSTPPSFELEDGTTVVAEVTTVGADWAAVAPRGRAGGLIVPFAAIAAIGMPHADILRTARPVAPASALADRMTLGFVLRGLVRRRTPVTVQLIRGRSLTGTIDRAGADHLDIALHDAGTPRRADAVTGYRVVPLSAVAWVQLESAVAVM